MKAVHEKVLKYAYTHTYMFTCRGIAHEHIFVTIL